MSVPYGSAECAKHLRHVLFIQCYVFEDNYLFYFVYLEIHYFTFISIVEFLKMAKITIKLIVQSMRCARKSLILAVAFIND